MSCLTIPNCPSLMQMQQTAVNCGQKVIHGAQNTLAIANYAVTDVEPLEKVVKLSARFIELTAALTRPLSASMSTIVGQLKETAVFFESIRFFASLKLLVVRDATTGNFLLCDAANSAWKKADRIFLALHTGGKMLGGLEKFSLINLGRVSKVAIGHLPIFKLVVDGFMVIRSVVGSIDYYHTIKQQGRVIDRAQRKIEKWNPQNYNANVVAPLRAHDQAKLDELGIKYQGKLDHMPVLQAQHAALVLVNHAAHPNYAGLTTVQRDYRLGRVQAKIADLGHQINKEPILQARVELIEAGDFDGLADELEQKNVNLNQRKWSRCKDKAEIKHTQSWLGILGNIAKIVVIALALTFTALYASWTVPIAVAVLACGIVSDSLGSAKLVLTKFSRDSIFDLLPA